MPGEVRAITPGRGFCSRRGHATLEESAQGVFYFWIDPIPNRRVTPLFLWSGQRESIRIRPIRRIPIALASSAAMFSRIATMKKCSHHLSSRDASFAPASS